MNPVKAAVVAPLSVILIVLAPVLLVVKGGGDSARAETVSTCPVVAGIKEGNALTVTACGQVFTVNVNDLANGSLELGAITLPPGEIITETVTLPPVTLPPLPAATVTLPPVKVPGPTKIIRLPGETVTVPGPTEFVPVPGETVTERVRIPAPTETVTVRPNIAEPSEAPTETVTVTAEPTGQPTPSRATVTPSPEVQTETETDTRTKTETIIRNLALGLLATLALVGLGMLALWLGYILGYKGAERNEARTLRNMLDGIKSGAKRS